MRQAEFAGRYRVPTIGTASDSSQSAILLGQTICPVPINTVPESRIREAMTGETKLPRTRSGAEATSTGTQQGSNPMATAYTSPAPTSSAAVGGFHSRHNNGSPQVKAYPRMFVRVSLQISLQQ
jgi:hypothetical protein